MKKTICITGGHLSPAYAVASYIKKHHPDIKIIFLGREKSFTSKEFQTLSAEEEVMKPVSDNIFLLPVERFGLSYLQIVSLCKSLVKSFQILSKEKPSVVVSFGGYVGLYVSLVAYVLRIPILIHEQTHTIGKANKFLAHLARVCCVSYQEMKSAVWKYTGFPLREEIILPQSKPSFSIIANKPILYITGGTTGAVPINDMCFPCIEEWLNTYMVVQQTGNLSLMKAEKLRMNLPEEKRHSYIISAYLAPADASWLMHHAACVISRSGANTVYELALTKVPSVLIPLALGNTEQMENATWLTSYAPTTIIPQQHNAGTMLIDIVKQITKEKSSDYLQVSTDGTQHIVDEIVSLL